MRWTEQQLADHLRKYGLPGADPVVDTSAPPFALPGEIVIDLPYPPSVNRLWRSSSTDGTSRVYLSPSYIKWKKAADALATGKLTAKPVCGAFEADIVVCAPDKGARGDIDNRIKAVLDWTQRVGVVLDDKHCRRLTIEWVERFRAPYGCRITVRACA